MCCIDQDSNILKKLNMKVTMWYSKYDSSCTKVFLEQ